MPRESSVLCWHSSPGCPQGTGLHHPGAPRSPAQPMLPSSGHSCEQDLAVLGTDTAWDTQLSQGTVPHTAPELLVP